MKKITDKFRENLVKQALEELDYSHKYKKQRYSDWEKNEFLVMNKKERTNTSGIKANIALGEVQKDLNTFLSKIDFRMEFKYIPGELGDSRKVKLRNSIKDKFAKVGQWDMLDLLGKREAGVYGRAIYLAYGEEKNKEFSYEQQIISAKHFFIDPDAGGRDIEKARYLGWYGLKLSKTQLENGPYLKSAIKALSSGNTAQKGSKETPLVSYNYFPQELQSENLYYFYRWITTGEDDNRYFLIFDTNGVCIQCELWEDVQKSNLYPTWTWAIYPEEFEFWSLGIVDLVREVEMAKSVIMNEVVTNTRKINNPKTALNVDMIRNLNEVKYSDNDYMEVTGDFKVNEAVQIFPSPEISTGLAAYDKLNEIVQATSGITAAVQGISEEKTLGVYQGNISQNSERFQLMQKSIESGYYRAGVLFDCAVNQFFKRKMALQILGTEGLEWTDVYAKDIQNYSGKNFDVIVSSSALEDQQNMLKAKQKDLVLAQYVNNPIANQKVVFDMRCKIAGFSDADISRVLNLKDSSTEETKAGAAEIFMALINKDNVPYYEPTIDLLNSMNELYRKHMGQMTAEQLQITDMFLQQILIPQTLETVKREAFYAQVGMQINGQPMPIPPEMLAEGQGAGGGQPDMGTPIARELSTKGLTSSPSKPLPLVQT